MTKEEFAVWLDSHKRLFPETGEWLRERGSDVGMVLEEWADVLAGVSVEHAKRVTRRMLSGELPRPDRWNIAGLPALVIANAPKRLPTAEEVNDPKNGWTPYRGMGR